MSSYPDFQDNRLIVNGIDLTLNFGMVLLDGFVLNPPEPKTSYIDIPGGNGFIDLTEALSGDVIYSQREQEFTFAILYPYDNWEVIKTRINNFLHGKSYSYRLTFDPDYTYRGRFTIQSYEHNAYIDGIVGFIKVKVVAEPYKYKEHMTYSLTAPGGKWFYFSSGRKPVRPVIQTEMPCSVTWNRNKMDVGVGTFRLNDVLFSEGSNALYINTFKITSTFWSDVAKGGVEPLTWDAAREYMWDEVQKLIPNEMTSTSSKRKDVVTTWGDMISKTWKSYFDDGITWEKLNYSYDEFTNTTVTQTDFNVYIDYEWGDL